MFDVIKRNLFQVSTIAGIVAIVASICGYEMDGQLAEKIGGVVIGIFMVMSDLPTGLRKKE